MTETFLRRIRSFVRRDGRMTDAQRDALKTQWPQVGLELEKGLLDFAKIFPAAGKLNLEIGFGSGVSLLAMAKTHPEENYIGIETYQPGIGSLLLGMMQDQVKNIRLYYADAVEVLQRCIPEASLDVIQIFFPDPWPKRKHHKRRLIQPEFVKLLVSRLKPNGMLHLATDWEHYAQQMMNVLSAESQLQNLAGEKQFSERSSQRPIITKFEKRGTQSGRQIWELQFKRNI